MGMHWYEFYFAWAWEQVRQESNGSNSVTILVASEALLKHYVKAGSSEAGTPGSWEHYSYFCTLQLISVISFNKQSYGLVGKNKKKI